MINKSDQIISQSQLEKIKSEIASVLLDFDLIIFDLI
jgi:hypothetical protein